MSRMLLMVRHGETDYNATGRMQGQLDTPLSTKGHAQAGEIAAVIAGYAPSLVISSDLARAHDTARRIAAAANVELRCDQRLRETQLGLWQGESRDDIDARYPGARARWRHDAAWAPPEGETRLEVAARMRAVVDDLMATHTSWDDGPVVIVAHGGSIGALTHNLLELPTERYHLVSGLGNGCFAQLIARPRFDLSRLPERGDQVSVAFDEATVQDPEWYLQCWNRSRNFAADS